MSRPSAGVNIQVLLRCRPINGEEKRRGQQQVVTCDESKKEVTIATTVAGKNNSRSFTFDKVFGQNSSQETVFREGVQPIVNEVMEGYSCTVFAYGQTGTGKTHTMQGDLQRSQEGELPAAAGVIPRAVKQIFDTLQKHYTEYSVKVTYLELYNEEITDLLGSEEVMPASAKQGQKGLPLLEAADGMVHVKGLEEEIVKSTDDIFRVLHSGSCRRRTAATDLNAQSSRSHSIFTIIIHMKETTPEGEELIKCGKLNLVDLAGSENIGRSGAKDGRAREAGEINKSLLTLSRVISNLVEHQPFVPYRDSKLTRLLRDSLGGKTKTCIVATVAPTVLCQEETIRTLEYAQKAKNIKNTPQANQKLTKTALMRELTGQIERYRAELAAAREKDGVYMPKDQYEKEQQELEALRAATRSQEEDIVKQQEEAAMQAREADARLHKLRAEMGEVIQQLKGVISNKEQELAREIAAGQKLQEELEATQANLDRTKTELQHSRGEVVRLNSTVIKKNSIIKKLETAEDSLAKMSLQLRTDHDGAVEDVDGLFSKLDRINSLEAENQTLRQQFAEGMETRKFEMLGSIADLQQAILRADEDTRSTLTSLIGRQKGATASHHEGMQTLASLLDQGLTCIEQHVRAHKVTMTVDIDTVGSSSNTFLDEAIKMFSDARDAAAVSQGQLQESIALMGTTLLELQDNWKKMAVSMDESAERVASIMGEGLSKISGAVEDASRRLDEDAAELKRLGAGMEKDFKDKQEEDIGAIFQMLEKLKERNNQQVHNLCSSMASGIEKSSRVRIEAKASMTDAADRAGEQTAGEMQSRMAVRDSHLSSLHGLNGIAVHALDDMEKMVDDIHAPYASAIGSFSESSNAQREAMSKTLLKAKADVSTLAARVQESAAAAANVHKEHKEKLDAALSASTASFVTSLEALSEASRERSISMNASAKLHSDDVIQTLDKVISYDPKKYSPTRSTPKKRALETVTVDQIKAARFKLSLKGSSPSPAKHLGTVKEAVTPRQALGDMSNNSLCYTTPPP